MSDRHGLGLATACALSLAIVAVPSCASSIDRGGLMGKDGGGGSGQDGGGGSGGGSGGSSGSGGSGGSGGSATDGGGASPDGMKCVTAEIMANKPPVDVIVLVDTSGSMQEEAANVQSNINKMGSYLAATGIDYRVVMIASSMSSSMWSFGVCVPPPLGGPGCASNPPIFRRVEQEVGSNDALDLILTTYDSTNAATQWSDFIRPEALKAFVPVTDDDAQVEENAPVLTEPLATNFDAELLRRGSGTFGTAAARKYVFQPICGADVANPTMMCGPGMQAPGAVYVELARLTGGKHFPLCATDFGPAFTAIGQGLASAVACEILVPLPPPGETLDPNKVNIVYVSSSGPTTKIPHDPTKPCNAGANGWQWTPDMKKIVLCGDACARLKADPMGKLTVELGCATCTGTVCN